MEKKKNILNYLFFCILINMAPIIMLGILKVENRIYTIANACAYMLEILVMIYAVKDDMKKVSMKKFTWIIILFCIEMFAQIIMYFVQGDIIIQDIISIISVAVNIFIFVFCISCTTVEQEDVLKFMKKIVVIGTIACIYNVLLNGKKMLHISSLTSSYSAIYSAFFPNRNQFGIFMIVVIISNFYLKRYKKSMTYRILEVFFIFNLVLTMSRNSIIGLTCIYMLDFYFQYLTKNKISKKKFLTMVLMILIVFVAIAYVVSNEKYIDTINRLFVRSDTLETGSGRTIVWKNGIEMVTENNILLGIGRFNALSINKNVYESELRQFHSIYIETFVTYGILGIFLFITLLWYIKNRIKHTNADIETKHLLTITIIVFCIISLFETTTRFSIGYADTISMIYFISVPIVISSSKKTVEFENYEDTGNIRRK